MKRKDPVRLAKKPEKKPLIKINNGTIAEIPLEFYLITIIMVCFFGLIIMFMGPTTESGMWFNMPHA